MHSTSPNIYTIPLAGVISCTTIALRVIVYSVVAINTKYFEQQFRTMLLGLKQRRSCSMTDKTTTDDD